MPLVAKRKVRETWRDAVARRARPDAAEVLLSRFDAMVASGAGEGEAAYRVLEEAGRLWVVDEPGAGRPAEAPPGEIPAV